jgi:ribosomal protein S18 acetylase RimI-like enzyme
MRIRSARQEDAACVAELARDTFVATFGHIYSSDDLATFLAASYSPEIQRAEICASDRLTLVAEDRSRLVAFAQAGPLGLPIDPGARRAAELKRLCLQSAFFGTGIADGLMAGVEAWARARAVEDLYLGVWALNGRAQRFYRRHGFEIVGRYIFRVGADEDDERIMRRALADADSRSGSDAGDGGARGLA